MQIIYLKSASEAAAKAALPMLLDEAGGWHMDSRRFDLITVGAIVAQPAVVDIATHELLQAATFVSGWHLNVYLHDAALAGEIVASGLVIDAPDTPRSVMAGWTPASEGGEG